ncbi:MobF family relaxase [Skermania sp. ID1734]|uniref:MobF family relaxase n=1 Tax=Skermania sp. ID1734 TaxID=2597516 RepID=UPI002101DA1F|nr:MobF family relaxase [Skermania sp. ID1734]
MSLHKLTAGDGYTYLTKQVAAMDATDKGRTPLADYYLAKGEAPGRWMGRGLEALSEPPHSPNAVRPNYFPPARPDVDARIVEPGSHVTEAQMKALFGEGRHPNADAIEAAFTTATGSAAGALEASKLGREFAINTADAPQFVQRLAEKFRDHNLANGNRWCDAIDPDERARLRTELATEMFTEAHGRPPADDREIAGFITTASRRPPSSVAGYDLTFSPVKSVSALWAIAPRSVAEEIEAAHNDAVADALAFIENNVALSRVGTGGVAQVDTDGLIAAAFTHRDSRAGDPDLHTHVTVSNKVRVTDRATGLKRWLALDGRPLHKAAVTASEIYNSRMEAHLRRRVGVDFAEEAGRDRGKRPVREIVGVPTDLIERWSSRRAAIEARTDELSAQFQADHGREPTSTEAFDLAQRATLETRTAKHEPRSLAEQRAAWRSEALAVFRGRFSDRSGEQALARMLADTTRTPVVLRTEPLTQTEVRDYAATVLDTVSSGRARWQRPHIRAEAERLLRGDQTLAPETISGAVEAITSAALGPDMAISCAADRLDGDLNEPAVLRRADGASVYTTHETDLFTTEAILAAETRIIAAARRTDGMTISPDTVDIALLEQAANGRELNAGQTAMVRELATSGRRVQVALAPAGTGKTTAMRTLATAWNGDGRTVIGLAPTAAAAAVLREELGTETDTVAKLVDVVTKHRDGRATDVPRWLANLDRGSLVVVDEAGMSGTADLDTLISHVLSTGASVRLIGDDQQLASISAGGVLRDVAHETGALTLSEVVRFSDPAEGSASLALREGDPAALGYYADHHRIHIAADSVAADQAYEAWTADRASGLDSVILAPTRETVNALNERARAQRLAENRAAFRPSRRREVTLADGLSASAGDIICTRLNKRSLRLSATDWVRNGDRWAVTEVAADGRITAKHLDLGRTLVLPSDYVAENVTLGYASTIHAAQGMTADTCHVVGSDMLSRQLLYVAMTRGRRGNHVYLSTAETDPHKVTTPKARTPDTGLEVLTGILGRDDAQASATTTAREALDPFRRLAAAAHAYDDALGAGAEHHLGAARITEIEAAATGAHPGLTDAAAWPVLRKHLATIEANGGDAVAEVRAAIAARELDTAADPAAVLDWRLDPSGVHSAGHGPLPWLPAIPTGLTHRPRWDTYLAARADRVADLSHQVAAAAAEWTLADAPRWARPLLAAEAPTDLIADLAVFRAATGVEDTDRRLTGPDQYAAALRRAQRRLDERAAAVVDTSTDVARWDGLADAIGPHLRRDPYWPELCEQLSAAARAGIDVPALAVDAAEQAPLPTEMPAAALWWRLSGELAPAVLDTTSTDITPDWIDDVAAVLGERAATAVITDPAWPSLVTAVSAASRTGWTPRDLLATAEDLLHGGVEGDHADTVRLDEYARALTWRIDLLATAPTAPVVDVVDAPLSPEAEEAAATAAGVGPDTHPDHDVTVPADTGVDDDYLAALLATEPPPDADLGAPPPEVDHYDELAFDDLTDARPIAPPALSDDVAVLIADRYETLAQLDEATREVAAVRDSLTYPNTGPHETAALPRILELRARQDAQRETAVAFERAHAEWADADHDVETLLTDRDDLLDLAAEARLSGDVDTAVRHEADAELLTLRITTAQDYLDTATTRLAAARDAYNQVCAQTGGPVTDRDIDTVRLLAQELDRGALDDARAHRDTLATRAWRLEAKLARRHGNQATHLRDIDLPDTAIDHDIPAADDVVVAPPVPDLVGVRAVTDAELATRERTASQQLARLDADRAELHRFDPDRGHATAAVRAAHERLHESAARAQAALTAAADATDAENAHARIAADAAAIRRVLDSARRRDRPALHDQLTALTAQHGTAAQRADLARRAADAAAAATGLRPDQWREIVARAADTSALSTELEQAQYKDHAAARTDARADANRAHYTAMLNEARSERDRRAALSPAERQAEDAARATSATADTPVTAPEMAPTLPTSPAAQHQVTTDNDAGLEA